MEYFERVIEMEPEGLFGVLTAGIKALIEGNINKGLQSTRKLEQADVADAEALYYFASLYGLLGDKEGCVRVLRKAVERGYFNYPFMLKDSFLDSVRDEPEIQRVLALAKVKHQAFKEKFFP